MFLEQLGDGKSKVELGISCATSCRYISTSTQSYNVNMNRNYICARSLFVHSGNIFNMMRVVYDVFCVMYSIHMMTVFDV